MGFSKEPSSLVVHDRFAAGYCSTIVENLIGALASISGILQCPADCDRACQHCLLQHDTHFRFDDLNRHAAAAFLGDTWLNALPLALLVDFISAVKQRYQDRWKVYAAKVVVAEGNRQAPTRNPSRVSDDWPSERERGGVIRAAFRYCGIDCNVVTHTKRNASHARLLEIKTGDGQRCTLWLDQGFSFWQIPRGGSDFSERTAADFCFKDDFDSQARHVCELHARISGQNFPTYIFADRG